MDADTIQEILRLHKNGMAKRAIARKLGANVKTIRRILMRHGTTTPNTQTVPQEHPERKLAPYYALIEEKAAQGLAGSRILREIRREGYTGGRTILLDYIRKLRGPSRASRRMYRRFETGPAEECQADWSPYRVQIAGKEQTVHCFSMLLCHSRYLFIQFHRDERLPTLLSAHVDGFRHFRGVTRRVVYDNMATVTFGRRGKDILWNPDFLKFTQHYLFEPFLCRVADPNRKGKVENPFAFVERDLLLGRTFQSWDDLDRCAAQWLKEIANRRVHSTTRLVPEEAWMDEREFLTALPETSFPIYREEIRPVYEDGLIAFDGTRYSVPFHLLGSARTVTIRAYPRSIEILDQEGRVIAIHRKPDFPGGLIMDEEHYESIRRKRPQEAGKHDHRFLARFPLAEPFLTGLKKRMKALYRIHISEIFRLGHQYGDDAVGAALLRAASYGNFNAYAVRRILQDRFPSLIVDVPPVEGIWNTPEAEIDDVETGSFDEYTDYSQGHHNQGLSEDPKEEE